MFTKLYGYLAGAGAIVLAILGAILYGQRRASRPTRQRCRT